MIKKRRGKRLSQRSIASMAGVSFRTVQLIESGKHDAKISTLGLIAASLGYPPDIIAVALKNIFLQPPDSIAMVTERILKDGRSSWKIWLFNFVDAFRKHRDPSYISMPPAQGLPRDLMALFASVAEALCAETGVPAPPWCSSVAPLKDPWFVANMESLKATALLESPVYFRKRNIFVLGNFLSRR